MIQPVVSEIEKHQARTMFWLIVCVPKTYYGKCPLAIYSHSVGHKNHCLSAVVILSPSVPQTHTFPWCAPSPSCHVCFLPGDSLKSSWSQTKVELLNWLWGKILRECNVSVSIQAASGKQILTCNSFFSLSPFTVCGLTFTSITAPRMGQCHLGDRHQWYIFRPFLPFFRVSVAAWLFFFCAAACCRSLRWESEALSNKVNNH